jgi:8-amino-7-oxononanoate synthase
MSTFDWNDFMAARLAEARARSLWRDIPPVDRGADRVLSWQGRRLLNLACNNYLGLAGRGELRAAAERAAQELGTTSGASRLVTGNFAACDELERLTAEFKAQRAALILGSGYMANLCVMAAFADRRTTVFSDRLNHASIVDGIALARAAHVRYRHGDMAHLEALLARPPPAPRKIIVTDTVFSMDGDVADLARIVELAQEHGALTVVDEAHATGVLGEGRGLAHELGLSDAVDVHMGTFSKALGSYGAYVAGREDVVAMLRNFGRPFIFSTALPPTVVAASLAALRLVAAGGAKARKLLDYAADLRHHLAALGFSTGRSVTQIIPVVMGDNAAALAARDFLMERGVLVPAIRPPSVPEGTARLRVSLRADLTEADMERVHTAFADLAVARSRGELA